MIWRWSLGAGVLRSVLGDLRGFSAGAFVIFDVLAECAYDPLLVSNGRFEFFIEARERAAVVRAERIQHGFSEIGQSL